MSSDDETARLLTVLAATTPERGRILELGTGVGHGTAALVIGLGARDDVRIVTIDVDEQRSTETSAGDDWPSYVEFKVGDALETLATLGQFDLIFADAPAGKHVGLELAVAALNPKGILLVDDMAKWENGDPEMHAKQERVREALHNHPLLVCCDLAWSTGLIVCAKKG